MGKSLTEVAQSVLLGESNDSAPDRDANKSTENAKTLKPGSKLKEPDPKKNEAEDLGGATPTAPLSKSLKVSVSKDTSKSSRSNSSAEPMHKLSEEDILDIMSNLIDEGYSDEEIAEAFLDEGIDISELSAISEEEESEDEGLAEAIANLIGEGYSDEEIFEIITEANGEDSNKDGPLLPTGKELKRGAKMIGKAVMDAGRGFKKEASEVIKGATKKATGINEESINVAMREHIDVLLEGEDLSEEFKNKATAIFEAAVNRSVNEQLETIEEAYIQSLEECAEELSGIMEEQVAEIYTTLSEKVDGYMTRVVEQWMTDNEVAIESGLKSEITSDFVSGLRSLFMEHNMDVPEESVPVVEELASRVSELEGRLNEEIGLNATLYKKIQEAAKNEVFATVTEGLLSTEVENIRSLAEGLNCNSVDEYAEKLEILRESYFPDNNIKSGSVLDNDGPPSTGKSDLNENHSGPMAQYVNAIGRMKPN